MYLDDSTRRTRPVKVTPIDRTVEAPEKRIPAKRVHKPVSESAERKGKTEGFTHGRRQAANRLEETESDQQMHQALRGESASDFLQEDLFGIVEEASAFPPLEDLDLGSPEEWSDEMDDDLQV